MANFKSAKLQVRFESFVYAILVVRFIGAIATIFYPITSPHTWRQVDTMATALRFARRWTVEMTDFSWWMPAVLNSGSTRGIMAMEFPAMNMLGALGFVVAGTHIDLGRRLAQGLVVVTVSGLIYLAGRVWRDADQKPEGMVPAALLAASCSFAIPFTAKFMPDITAMLLALIGTAGVWRLRAWGVLPLALALLMKPTSGIVAALLLLHPLQMRVWGKQLVLVVLALVPAGIWYFEVTQYLKSLQEIPSLFELFQDRDAVAWLAKFWLSAEMWDLFSFHLVFQFGWVLLWLALGFTKDRARRLMMLKLWGILIIQGSLIGVLSGHHARLHAYYLVGAAPTLALLIYHAWHAMPSSWVRVVLALGLFIHVGEAAVADMSGIWNPGLGAGWFAECRELREKSPDAPWHQGLAWRTPREEYPLIDLCIGERGQSSVGAWGVFRVEQPTPADCRDAAATSRLKLVRCSE